MSTRASARWRSARTARRAPRVVSQTDRAELELFAQSLGRDDRGGDGGDRPGDGDRSYPRAPRRPGGGRQRSGGAGDLSRAGQVRPLRRAHAGPTCCTRDARAVWVPDAATQALRRRVARRAALVRQRTRAKNEVHAMLARCLLGRSPVSDLFGVRRARLAPRRSSPRRRPRRSRAALRQIDFLDGEIARSTASSREWAVGSTEARRLMTIPGVGARAAVTLMAAIGDISRFDSSPQSWSPTWGSTPRCASPAMSPPATGGSQSAVTPRPARCWSRPPGARSAQPGPLRAFGERIRVRKGSQVAAVAVARKIACLCWQLLSKDEDYAYARPSLAAGQATPRRTRRRSATAPKRHGGQRSAPQPRSARPSASWSSAPRRPTDGSSPTGRQPDRARRAPARQLGAHLLGRLHGKQRGRISPRACALARRHRRPPETIANGGDDRKVDLTFIRNARTCPNSRRLLVRRVLEEGWSLLTEAAEAAGVSARTAGKWVRRYRAEGEAGLLDRSSAPAASTTSPHRSGSRRSPPCGGCD